MKILLTGATGYIGGRLVQELLKAGHEVRVLVRNPERIAGRPWTSKVEVFKGDLVKNESLVAALEGVDTAYYLVHSMLAGKDFEDLDRAAAENFAAASRNLKHTIYLGGLLPENGECSPHLKSRAEVGQILRTATPTTEFRAGPIIGSGSASFEMLRYLTERLPVMIAPKWIRNKIQPLAVRDVLAYLVAALNIPPSGVIEVGADRLTFKQMIQVFAEVRGLRRGIFPVPILAPGLASHWVGLITPIPNSIAKPLIQGIIQPLTANTAKAEKLFPHIKPIPYRRAVELALVKLQSGEIETRWSNALGAATEQYTLKDEEGMIREVRSLKVKASSAELFRAFSRLGGHTGWLAWNWAWQVRGLLDRLVGGPGLRRGRRHPVEALTGEALDFWRVEAVASGHLLRLRAEMKVPGRAWLEWEAKEERGETVLTQVASFAPKGLAGLLYWYSLYPIHARIFSDMAKAIANEAEKSAAEKKAA
jgi:uncharacterized protein YbjT (DUF2867 family)